MYNLHKMKNETKTIRYVAFLRGINVGGNKKVPMAILKESLKTIGFSNIETLLNSGNIIFEAPKDSIENLEEKMANHLERVFGFAIPSIIRTAKSIIEIVEANPFKSETLTKELRFYISFLKTKTNTPFQLPWQSEDQSFQILSLKANAIISLLDVSKSKTPKAMAVLEKEFSKNITTRNWNTILKIEKKLNT